MKGSQKGDVNTEYWDDLWLQYKPINEAKVRTYFDVFDFFTLSRDKTILDIGCGSGETLLYLKKKGFKKLEGLEPEKRLFEKKDLGMIREGNLLSIKTKKKYDVVLVFGVLHHLHTLKDMKLAIDNIARVLKKGGKFYSVEQWKNIIRTIAMVVVKNAPRCLLPGSFKIEKELLKLEYKELTHWLKVEKQVTRYAERKGLKIHFFKKDLRYRYIVFEKQ